MNSIPHFSDETRHFAFSGATDERRVYIFRNEKDIKIETRGKTTTNDLMALIIFGAHFCVAGANFRISSCQNDSNVVCFYVSQNDLCVNNNDKKLDNILCECMHKCYQFIGAPRTELKKIFQERDCEIQFALNGEILDKNSKKSKDKDNNWHVEAIFYAPNM